MKNNLPKDDSLILYDVHSGLKICLVLAHEMCRVGDNLLFYRKLNGVRQLVGYFPKDSYDYCTGRLRDEKGE